MHIISFFTIFVIKQHTLNNYDTTQNFTHRSRPARLGRGFGLHKPDRDARRIDRRIDLQAVAVRGHVISKLRTFFDERDTVR